MSFAYPGALWLALLLTVAVSAAVYGYAHRRRHVARTFGDLNTLARLGGGNLDNFPARRLLLVGLAAAALGFAAAGPRWGTRAVERKSRAGSLVLLLDASRSMLARDLSPNRLERERILARRLLRELPGDRVGLVVFAGRAHILSPLTVDHSALELYLDALDPEIVSYGGSSLAAGLRQASELARGDRERAARAAVVLISDGEALEEEAAVLAEAERAARAGVVIHAVGVGTARGAPVPERDTASGEIVSYKRDPAGDVVVSKLNQRLLERVAERTNGRYVLLDQAGATDRLLLALRSLERATVQGERGVEPRERFPWFIGLALALLALDTILARAAPPAARAAAQAPQPVTARLHAQLVLWLCLALLAFGFGDLERGNRLYRQGRYAEAVAAYRAALQAGSQRPELRYNLGTALLRLGRFEEAEPYLRTAGAGIEPALRARAAYNLGNRYLLPGRRAEPEPGVAMLGQAVEAYKRALRLDPADRDAKWNLELALRERERQRSLEAAAGGGGGQQQQDQPEQQDRTGGSAGSSSPAAPPSPSAGGSEDSRGAPAGQPMTREQAERILSAIEQDERELYRETLRKGRRETPLARDW
ncbi:MAG: VWA domain-containing protein [Gemmatimonadetes bacterium]|nr:VWA domain-containing protein [Gemmatimonadota bacterium]